MLDPDAFARLAFLADRLAHALQLERHLLVGRDNLVEVVGDLARQPRPRDGQAHTEIAILHGLQALKNGSQALRHRRFQRADRVVIIAILPADGRFNGRRHSGVLLGGICNLLQCLTCATPLEIISPRAQMVDCSRLIDAGGESQVAHPHGIKLPRGVPAVHNGSTPE